MAPFEYYRATSLADALGQMAARAGAVPLAGGTNLVDMMKAGAASPDLLVDLGGVAGYRDVTVREDGGVSIGALATNADVADHPDLLSRYPLVAEALLAGASPQLRNAASIGGNVMQSNRCGYFWDRTKPCSLRVSSDDCSARDGIGASRAIFAPGRCLATNQSDLTVALTAHDAQLEIASATGARTTALADLFQRNSLDLPCRAIRSDELITSVLLPPTPFGKGHAYVKVRERASFAFALCSVAALLQLDEGRMSAARLFAGSVADRPWRLDDAEHALIGQSPTPALFDAVARLGTERAEPIRSDAWKCTALQGAINKALRIALYRETGISLHE